MNSAHEQCPNSNLNSVQVATSHWPTQVATSFPPQAEQARSRPQNDVATSSSTGQVATSIPCRNLLDDQTYVATSSSCRDLNSQQARSRRQFHVATSWRLTYVATSSSCRDLNSQQARSRRQFHGVTTWRLTYVATSTSCRDLVPAHSEIFKSRRQQSRSRPPTLLPMSRHQIHVATPFLPNQSRPGRDFTSLSRPHAQPSQVATS